MQVPDLHQAPMKTSYLLMSMVMLKMCLTIHPTQVSLTLPPPPSPHTRQPRAFHLR